ncbi:hypothetical protein LQ327_17645 [Actinomycetospora endophytica]|uniref:Uncharacterized protein n=1 Tax=Actinomycetospora endophytica TaxID=2291215 RepID=A0ABS8PAB8_9PSEU|nr:hypothetical protein [Actinomycetospora endophytica]MCD2195194.1 hypothetical protein [Actinomycetospora endophytica]
MLRGSHDGGRTGPGGRARRELETVIDRWARRIAHDERPIELVPAD